MNDIYAHSAYLWLSYDWRFSAYRYWVICRLFIFIRHCHWLRRVRVDEQITHGKLSATALKGVKRILIGCSSPLGPYRIKSLLPWKCASVHDGRSKYVQLLPSEDAFSLLSLVIKQSTCCQIRILAPFPRSARLIRGMSELWTFSGTFPTDNRPLSRALHSIVT